MKEVMLRPEIVGIAADFLAWPGELTPFELYEFADLFAKEIVREGTKGGMVLEIRGEIGLNE